MEYLTQLEKMLESGHRIIMMETFEVDHVCDLFLELSRFSTKPYYLAQPGQAMHRMGTSHIGIPKTTTAEDLVGHLESSQYYGVYVLKNYMEILEEDGQVKELVSIATGEHHKVIIMLAEHITIPEKLKPYVVRSKHQMKETG